MFKYLTGTLNKFILIIICIFIKFQLNAIYENVRGTLEGVMAKGQLSSDSATYLWAKLLSDGLILNVINYVFYIIIFWAVFKIGLTIYSNRNAISAMNSIVGKKLF